MGVSIVSCMPIKALAFFKPQGFRLFHAIVAWVQLKCSASAFQWFFFFFTLRGTFQCFLMNSVYYLWNPQTSFFNKIFIKNRSYGTIHTFKNYFTIMFSVFNFQQNKRYSNRSVHLETAYLAEKLEIENFLLKIPQIKLKSS